MTLDLASAAFRRGYRLAAEERGAADRLLDELLDLDPSERPFAFEGAAMGCRVLDARDSGDRTRALREGADSKWLHLIGLGVGCALARLGADPPRDPVELDGFGFQLGLESGTSGSGRSLGSAHAERGRGRALWFVTGGRPDGCRAVIDDAPMAGALWRGIGTACAFAGDPLGAADRLLGEAGRFEEEVRRGVADAVALWTALEGDVPGRTLAVERAIG